ncbi:endonuclease NucS [Corynebacterium choanae]|uniref:Endonuclease NucS n=1 Tax=Corynebacterium choanae TaxID=1862358 RepID=A0A3G6J5G9_9CORY|nr:endonuclease NucS [Corynebacterium choanae]AZA13335.1 hypothetical protein CCHOA_04635 [Corynebacterium choanae]
MRVVFARCSVDYDGRLSAHLPMADRLLMIKADGSISIHADDRAYKPLNWMSPPCQITEIRPLVDRGDEPALLDVKQDEAAIPAVVVRDIAGDDTGPRVWKVTNAKRETLTITIEAIHHDTSYALGRDPGLEKDGVEAHLQRLLAEQIETLGDGYDLIRREYPTPIGPVDILCTAEDGATVAVEIKRRGEIDGVEQLTRYLEFLNRDSTLAPVSGVFAAQQIKPQARVLAEDRGIRCVVLDYDELRGKNTNELRLF